jgi:type I restriction enzyme S subunit
VRGIENGVPSVGGEHLTSQGTFNFDNVKYVPEAFFESMRRGRIRVGDVLVVKDGATTGKVALVRSDFPFEEAVVNEHVFICRPRETVNPDYLFWFLYSPEGQRRILEHFQGSAQGGINQTFALGTHVPIAPCDEQKRLVALIESAAAKASTAAQRCAAASSILRRFRQAVLVSACSGRLTSDWRETHDAHDVSSELRDLLARLKDERASASASRTKTPLSPHVADSLPDLPASWQWIAADAACSMITKGTTPRSDLMSQDAGEVPYLKVYNLTFTGALDFSVRPTFVPRATHDGLLKRSRVFPGDVLMNIVGPPLGKVSLVPDDYPEWNINQAIAFFRPLPSVRSDFTAVCLLSPPIVGAATRRAKATAGQHNLTLEICKELALPVPPPSEQAEIIRRVHQLLSLADKVEQRIEATSTHVERSTQAVLAKAFRGELALAGMDS